MRLIVPLQGVVQGRIGLILGSLIPCALFYFLHFYLKRAKDSPSTANLSELSRSPSRANLRAQLSARGTSFAKPSDSPHYIGFNRVCEDPYDEIGNPNGIIQLGLAENRLSLDLIDEWISKTTANSIVGLEGEYCGVLEILTYQPPDGMMSFKMVMADFMTEAMKPSSVSFDPSRLVVTSGTNPALEILSFCLADQGNAFLVPTPYYPGFDMDIKCRTGVELIPVHSRSCDNFTLSIVALEQAYNQARKRGKIVSGILFSNPSNPIGNSMNRDLLCNILYFARDKNIHIISDEIFAGSRFGDEDFVSMAEVVESDHCNKERVHIVYGLSKDLSIPGFRIGVIYSFNDNIISASKKLARFSNVSSLTQRLLTSMLSDKMAIRDYLKTNKERIRLLYEVFVAGLRGLGLECIRSHAGLYCWVNLSCLISPYSEKGEIDLWEKLIYTAKINVTPGSACHCIEPGWFRFCFATLKERDICVVLDRLLGVVQTSKVSYVK